jgi:hypothetical protein
MRQADKMKVGIVGPISKDRIIWPNGEAAVKFGSVVYSATVLAKLFETSPDEVVCITHMNSSDAATITGLLAHPNIRLGGSGSAAGQGTEIELRYLDQHERISRQTSIMTPISFAELSMAADCDYIILMPLNQTDIELAQVLHFRQRSTAVIFLDLHGLITGVNEQGKRYRKNWEQPEAWLKAIDILKMNDKEAAWAAGRQLETFADYLQFAVDMVKKQLIACWITFGDRSSLVVWRRDRKMFWATVPVTNTGEVVDTIGCGDAASAGFIYAYAKLHSPLIAVVMGNMLGSVKAATCEANHFPTRPEVRSLIYQHYREYFHNLLDEFLSQQHLIVNEIKEDMEHESLVYGTNGDRYCHGADDARGSHSQESAAPWT